MVSGKRLNLLLVVSFGDRSCESSFFCKWNNTGGKLRPDMGVIIFDSGDRDNISGVTALPVDNNIEK